MAGKPLILEEWQMAIVGNIFGWLLHDGRRRYREALIFVPRKNGKSTLGAGIGNLVFFADHEPGAEIYSVAAEREQAALIWGIGRYQIQNEPRLAKRCTIYTGHRSIMNEEDGSSWKPISAEANTKHGANSHLILSDELHAQKTPELIETMITSTGSRRQPLILHFTTSDFERENSICNEKHAYASNVRDGRFEDENFLPVIYEAKLDDDFTDPEIWRKANPNLGVSISEEYLERECKRAKENPSYENTFKRLHLNIRTEAAVRWLSIASWDECGGPIDWEEMKGKECYAGLDLSSTQDITALVLVFPDYHNALLPFFWAPKENAREKQKKDGAPYLKWAREGHIHLTEGNVIDYSFIRKRVNELSKIYDIREIAFDPWNAKQLATQLTEEDGLPMIEFRQGFFSMNEPAKHFESLVVSRKLRHGDNPILRWMASNVSVKEDPAGNIKPDKTKSSEKIDGIVAAIMGLGCSMVATQQNTESVYSTRGILQL